MPANPKPYDQLYLALGKPSGLSIPKIQRRLNKHVTGVNDWKSKLPDLAKALKKEADIRPESRNDKWHSLFEEWLLSAAEKSYKKALENPFFILAEWCCHTVGIKDLKKPFLRVYDEKYPCPTWLDLPTEVREEVESIIRECMPAWTEPSPVEQRNRLRAKINEAGKEIWNQSKKKRKRVEECQISGPVLPPTQPAPPRPRATRIPGPSQSARPRQASYSKQTTPAAPIQATELSQITPCSQIAQTAQSPRIAQHPQPARGPKNGQTARAVRPTKPAESTRPHEQPNHPKPAGNRKQPNIPVQPAQLPQDGLPAQAAQTAEPTHVSVASERGEYTEVPGHLNQQDRDDQEHIDYEIDGCTGAGARPRKRLTKRAQGPRGSGTVTK